MTCHTLFKLCAGRHASRHVPQRNPCVTAAVLLLLLLSRDDMWRPQMTSMGTISRANTYQKAGTYATELLYKSIAKYLQSIRSAT